MPYDLVLLPMKKNKTSLDISGAFLTTYLTSDFLCIIKICSENWTVILLNDTFYSMSSKAEYLKKYLEPTAEKNKKKKKKRKGQNMSYNMLHNSLSFNCVISIVFARWQIKIWSIKQCLKN